MIVECDVTPQQLFIIQEAFNELNAQVRIFKQKINDRMLKLVIQIYCYKGQDDESYITPSDLPGIDAVSFIQQDDYIIHKDVGGEFVLVDGSTIVSNLSKQVNNQTNYSIKRSSSDKYLISVDQAIKQLNSQTITRKVTFDVKMKQFESKNVRFYVQINNCPNINVTKVDYRDGFYRLEHVCDFEKGNMQIQFVLFNPETEEYSNIDKQILLEVVTPLQLKEQLQIANNRIQKIQNQYLRSRNLIARFSQFVTSAFSSPSSFEDGEKIIFVHKILLEFNSKQKDYIAYKALLFSNKNEPLPILSVRQQIINNKTNQMVISSATGSGKTLLVPLFLMEDGQNYLATFMTQPNKSLVRSNAKTIIDKVLEHSNQFPVITDIDILQEEILAKKQQILCICTPHELLKFLLTNQDKLDNYRFILDEFHERRSIMDCIFAFLIKNLKQQKFNQVVLMSATPSFQVISKLNNCALIQAHSQTNYPIECEEIKANSVNDAVLSQPIICLKVEIDAMIQEKNHMGHILVFQPGPYKSKQFLETFLGTFKDPKVIFLQTTQLNQFDFCDYLKKLDPKSVYILPIFFNGQTEKFDRQLVTEDVPQNVIKIIIATQMGASGLTIPNLKVVIDTGIANDKVYQTESDTTSIQELAISQESRIQRKGRVGRTCPGRVYQIFYSSGRDLIPELLKTDQLKSLLELYEQNFSLRDYNKFLPDPLDDAKINALCAECERMKAISADKITQYGLKLLHYKSFSPRLANVIEKVYNSNVPNKKQLCLYIGLIFSISAESKLLKAAAEKVFEMFTPDDEMDFMIKLFASQDHQRVFNSISLKTVLASFENMCRILFHEHLEDDKIDIKVILQKLNLVIKDTYLMPQAIEAIQLYNPKYLTYRTCVFKSIKKLQSQQGERMSFQCQEVDRQHLEYVCFERLNQDKEFVSTQQLTKYQTHNKVLFFGIQESKYHQVYCTYYFKCQETANNSAIHYLDLERFPIIQCYNMLTMLNVLLSKLSELKEFIGCKSQTFLLNFCDQKYIYQSAVDQDKQIFDYIDLLFPLRHQPKYLAKLVDDQIMLLSSNKDQKYAIQKSSFDYRYQMIAENVELLENVVSQQDDNLQIALDVDQDKLLILSKHQQQNCLEYKFQIIKQQKIEGKQLASIRSLLPENMRLLPQTQHMAFIVKDCKLLHKDQEIKDGYQLLEIIDSVISNDQGSQIIFKNIGDVFQLQRSSKFQQCLMLEQSNFSRKVKFGSDEIQQSLFQNIPSKYPSIGFIATVAIDFTISVKQNEAEGFKKILNAAQYLGNFVWINNLNNHDFALYKISCFGVKIAEHFVIQYLEQLGTESHYELPDDVYNLDLARVEQARKDVEFRCKQFSLSLQYQRNQFHVYGKLENILKFRQSEICKYKAIRYKVLNFEEIDERVKECNINIIYHREGVFIVHLKDKEATKQIVKGMLEEFEVPADSQCFGCGSFEPSNKLIYFANDPLKLCVTCYIAYFQSLYERRNEMDKPEFLNIKQEYSLPQIFQFLQQQDSQTSKLWLDQVDSHFKFLNQQIACPAHKTYGLKMPIIYQDQFDGRDVVGKEKFKSVPVSYSHYCNICSPRTYYCENCNQWHQWNKHLLLFDNVSICPNCKQGVTKVEGTCNKIHCNCGKYFCYVCCDTIYDSEPACYGHMEQKHGDYYTPKKSEPLVDTAPEPTDAEIQHLLSVQGAKSEVEPQIVRADQTQNRVQNIQNLEDVDPFAERADWGPEIQQRRDIQQQRIQRQEHQLRRQFFDYGRFDENNQFENSYDDP